MRHLLAIALLGFSFAVIAEAPRPSGPPPDGPPGPPPEAVAACSGRTQGAACSFKTPRGDQMSGTCAAPPAPGNPPGGRGEAASPPPPLPRDAGVTQSLSCRPANPPPRPG